ncbi:MAG: monooxygenase, partial [Bacteroidota bacterium]|nr:monooxygenase [Bacteroidota bacterium]
LNFGYYYTGSPIIAADDVQAPAYSMGGFTASTVPGCRAPHFWLRDGRSLYDAFGPGYTLLRFDRSTDVSALESSARESGLPLVVLDVDGEETPPAYEHKLVMCRSDFHVAWRGNSVPASTASLVAKLSGADQQLIATLEAAG